MANEMKWTYASQVTLESSGASAASAAFIAADDTTLASGNHSNYPYADFVLKTVGFGAALTSTGSWYCGLWRQDLNIDSTAGDEGAPTALNRLHYCGGFVLPNSAASTSTNYVALTDVELVADQAYFVEVVLNTSLAAGWTLKVTPKTLMPVA
jgi:hypothetical protein